MKKLIILLGVTLSLTVVSCKTKKTQAETSPNDNEKILMTVAGEEVTLSEFKRVYEKNNPNPKYDKESIDEYLKLFKQFKLKVKAAEEAGIDTTYLFKKELEKYERQLAAPYLTDKAYSDAILEEAYQHTVNEVSASHIMINLPKQALPADTLKAYNTLMEYRKRAMNGEDFAVLAKKYSQDPSAQNNKGYLGYFSAFQMVYPFEKAAFDTKVGEVSYPTRSLYGYHIIKVHDKRKALGKIKAAHIMVISKETDAEDSKNKAKKKIFEIYEKLKSGNSFEELAKQYSEDPSSNKEGGVLQVFGSGKMVPEFEKRAFDLKNDDDFSEPFLTSYGWHIVKRLELYPVKSREELLPVIKSKVTRDRRSDQPRQTFLDNKREEFGYKRNEENFDYFVSLVNDSIFMGVWSLPSEDKLGKDLFILGNKTYKLDEFAKFVYQLQRKVPPTTARQYIEHRYKGFLNQKIEAQEKELLPSKHPEYKHTLKEYRDGILLFDITEKEVWKKAQKDSAGLDEFYNQNKEKYKWKERYEGAIYVSSNRKMVEQAMSLVEADSSNEQIKTIVNRSSQLNLKVIEGKLEKEKTDYLKGKALAKGISPIMKNGIEYYFMNVKDILPAQPKKLEEARGSVISDYQEHLQKTWLDKLAQKFPIDVNQEVLNSIIQ